MLKQKFFYYITEKPEKDHFLQQGQQTM